MHLTEILHYACYTAILGLGVYGVQNIVMMIRQIRRRSFRNPEEAAAFLSELREHFRHGQYEDAEALCTLPQTWYKATAILTKGVLERRDLPLSKIRPTLAAQFNRDIMTSLESMLAAVNVAIKTEPMLGLWGTVLGMIGAFSRIATIEHPSPQDLMQDLSVALNATAMGLSCAIPLLVSTKFLQDMLRRFEETTLAQMHVVLEDLDAARTSGRHS